MINKGVIEKKIKWWERKYKYIPIYFGEIVSTEKPKKCSDELGEKDFGLGRALEGMVIAKTRE